MTALNQGRGERLHQRIAASEGGRLELAMARETRTAFSTDSEALVAANMAE